MNLVATRLSQVAESMRKTFERAQSKELQKDPVFQAMLLLTCEIESAREEINRLQLENNELLRETNQLYRTLSARHECVVIEG
jgi:hypothetical protein